MFNPLSFENTSDYEFAAKGERTLFIPDGDNGAAARTRASNRRSRFHILLEYYTHVNKTKRAPCPTCGNLVKPELQGQHDYAYHSDEVKAMRARSVH